MEREREREREREGEREREREREGERAREICEQGDCHVFFLYLSIPLFSVLVNDLDFSIVCSRTPPIPHTTMYLLMPSLFVGTVLGEHWH